MVMPKVKKMRNKTSLSANAIITRVVNELTEEITNYLDEKQEFEFDDTANISFANEEMRMIVKRDDKYLLITLDNNSGSEFYEYEIEDWGKISVYDLIWILEQIELEEGV
jgi:hypothetical protein